MKDWFKEQMESAKRSSGKGPTNFFYQWQRTSQSNQDQEYYKDLMKKIFLGVAGLFLIRLVSGVGSSRRTNPAVEDQYMRQQSQYAMVGEQRMEPNY